VEYDLFKNPDLLKKDLKGRRSGIVGDSTNQPVIDPLVRGATDIKRDQFLSSDSFDSPQEVQSKSDCDTPDGIVLINRSSGNRADLIDGLNPVRRISSFSQGQSLGFIDSGQDVDGFLG
jgi:hypothetical protein